MQEFNNNPIISSLVPLDIQSFKPVTHPTDKITGNGLVVLEFSISTDSTKDINFDASLHKINYGVLENASLVNGTFERVKYYQSKDKLVIYISMTEITKYKLLITSFQMTSDERKRMRKGDVKNIRWESTPVAAYTITNKTESGIESFPSVVIQKKIEIYPKEPLNGILKTGEHNFVVYGKDIDKMFFTYNKPHLINDGTGHFRGRVNIKKGENWIYVYKSNDKNGKPVRLIRYIGFD